jgi:hypothetical protein
MRQPKRLADLERRDHLKAFLERAFRGGQAAEPSEGAENGAIPMRGVQKGRFKLKRIMDSKRVRRKLIEVKTELRRHLAIPEQGRWLSSVLRGHCSCYAVA